MRRTRTPFRGWRVWRLLESRDEGPLLASPMVGTLWEGPVLAADRPPDMERLAVPSGIYAHAAPSGLASSLLCDGDAVVYGEVTLFGVVCVHETGYRAERARVDRLFLRHCGPHPLEGSLPATTALELPVEPAQQSGQRTASRTFVRTYCGCRDIVDPHWLPPETLHALANALSRRYGCDTVVDPTKPPPGRSCVGARLTLLK